MGDTLVERDQRYGYLETMLTLLNPEKDLTFRNLGWSGDTVAGLSRAGFDPPEAGYRQLIEQVLAAKPTVLIVGYGMADSFDGEAGRPRFVAGLNRFLDATWPRPAAGRPALADRPRAAGTTLARPRAAQRDAGALRPIDRGGRAEPRRLVHRPVRAHSACGKARPRSPTTAST